MVFSFNVLDIPPTRFIIRNMNYYALEVKNMNKKILLFGVDETQQAKIKVFCDSLSIEVDPVEKKDYNQPISSIVGFPKTKSPFNRRSKGKIHSNDAGVLQPYHMTGFPEPMMVFCNLEQEDLNHYLEGYNDAGIDRISLKAIVTPYNISWTPEQLFEELLEEHQAMTQKN